MWRNRSGLSLKEPNDAFQGDLCGRAVEAVAAVGAAFGADDPGRAQGGHHLFEDGGGYRCPFRELVELDRLFGLGECECKDSAGGVVGSLRNPHA